MTTVARIMAALFARERSGRGQLVATSLLRTGVYILGFDLNIALRLGFAYEQPTRTTMSNALTWWALVQQPEEVVHDPQAEMAGAFVDVPLPDGETARMVATPVEFSTAAVQPGGPVPEAGQHTEEVLLELGMDWEAIAGLKERGVIP